jgi:hypothetical protein
MNVGQLITKLQTMPKNASVFFAAPYEVNEDNLAHGVNVVDIGADNKTHEVFVMLKTE